MKKAFTLLELVFVILILGILASLSFSFANQNK
ncbi:type II secretion system protein, partial [Campylobacter coli]|nr:type II secretion system protein [Campylobacter coli]